MYFKIYKKPLCPGVDFIIVAGEDKSKYGSVGSQITLKVGIRFVQVEELINDSHRDFFVSQGKKPDFFTYYTFPSIYEKLFEGYSDDAEGLESALQRFLEYCEMTFGKTEIDAYKKNIINLEITSEFSSSDKCDLAMRALIFAYLDRRMDEIDYFSWYKKYPELSDTKVIKLNLDILWNWLEQKK